MKRQKRKEKEAGVGPPSKKMYHHTCDTFGLKYKLAKLASMLCYALSSG